MQYDSGSYCVFYHRYHRVALQKNRYNVLTGEVWLRVRDICRHVCRAQGGDIIRGVLSSDHVHMFVSVPPKLAVSDPVRLMKGRSSHKVQCEFPQLKRRYWGRRFLGAGTSRRPTVPSTAWQCIAQQCPERDRRYLYFSTSNSTSPILLAPAGGGSVKLLMHGVGQVAQ